MGVQHTPLGMLPHKARRTIMDPTTTCCPNRNCPARGQTGPHSTGFSGKQIISPCEGNASPGFPWVSRRAPLTDRHGHKKITSTTSMPYNFTTKSGGVWLERDEKSGGSILRMLAHEG